MRAGGRCPGGSLTFRRESSRNRPGHGRLRVRNRPRKRRAPQGRCAWGMENSCRHAPGAQAQDDLRRRGGVHRGARAGRRRARGVLRRRRRPHRALRRTGERRRSRRRARAGVECLHEYAPAGSSRWSAATGVPRSRRCRGWSGDPGDAEAADAEPCRRRAGRRDLPRARAPAAEGRLRMIARLRGKAVARSPDALVLEVNGVGYLVQPTRRAARRRARRARS